MNTLVLQVIALNVSDSFDITNHVQSLGVPDDSYSSVRRLIMNVIAGYVVSKEMTSTEVDSLFSALRDDSIISSIGHSLMNSELAVEEVKNWVRQGYNHDGLEDPIQALIKLSPA